MPLINHLICLPVIDLAYTSDVIAHDLQVFEANFTEKCENNILKYQLLIHKEFLFKLLGKLIISIVLFALACASYALC